jgi:hypothetical protein
MSARVLVFETYRDDRGPTYDITSPRMNHRLKVDAKKIIVINNTDTAVTVWRTLYGAFGSLTQGFYNMFDEPLYAKRANSGRYGHIVTVPAGMKAEVATGVPTKEILV